MVVCDKASAPVTAAQPNPALLSLPRISTNHILYLLLLNTRRNKERKMPQYTANDNNHCFNNTNSFNNVWNNCTVADDRPQLLTWLSPLEPSLRHRDIRERRVNSVGEWLVQSGEFRSWCGLNEESKDASQVLFCYGGPGVGKTFIR